MKGRLKDTSDVSKLRIVLKEKERARMLIDYYRTLIMKADVYDNLNPYDEIDLAKQSALIAVNVVLGCPRMNDDEQVQYLDGTYAREYYEVPNKYWTKVKEEIENYD
jgi:hypothetical protein